MLCIMSALPPPDDSALAHRALLRQRIQDQVSAAGGAIPFSRFMEMCLYAPGLGYYSAGASKFGEAGDFVTAPELGPLFAACTADAMAPVIRQLGPDAEIVELGGGSGAFAEVALKRLLALDALPARYAILEPSADLRQRQQERLRERLNPLLADLVEWLDAPPAEQWNGVLFANEVVDALPTPRFALRDGEVFEEHVALDGPLQGARPELGGEAELEQQLDRRLVPLDRPRPDAKAAALEHGSQHEPKQLARGRRVPAPVVALPLRPSVPSHTAAVAWRSDSRPSAAVEAKPKTKPAAKASSYDRLNPFAAKLLQAPHAAFVSRPSRFDPLPYPGFFLGQHLVEFGILLLFGFQPLRLALLPRGKIAGEAEQLAAVEFDDAGRHGVEEASVVSDDHHAAPCIEQQMFQPSYADEVQVVGRLVEQEQVGLVGQGASQRNPFPGAAG